MSWAATSRSLTFSRWLARPKNVERLIGRYALPLHQDALGLADHVAAFEGLRQSRDFGVTGVQQPLNPVEDLLFVGRRGHQLGL